MGKIFFILSLSFLIPFSVIHSQAVPPAPVIIDSSIYDSSSVVYLSWEPDGDGGSDILGYKVSYKVGEIDDVTTIDTPNVYLEIELAFGRSYELWVVAFNEFGSGAKSDSVFLDIPERQGGGEPPLIIEGPTISNITKNSATLNWATDKGASATIEIGVHPRYLNRSMVVRSILIDHEIVIDELSPCVKYYYKIISQDDEGNTNEDFEILNFTTRCLGQVLKDNIFDIKAEGAPDELVFYNDVKIGLDRSSFGEESVIQVKRIDMDDLREEIGCPADKKSIGGRVYDFKLLENLNPVENLNQSVFITMYYEEEDIIGINEDDISMYHYNEKVNSWDKLNQCVLDKSQKSITCETETFSKFMLGFESKCQPFTQTMFLGTYHPEVLRLQRYLSEKGYYKDPKGTLQKRNFGFFDFKTLRAVSRYQKEHKENIPFFERFFGVLGKKTRAIIR